MSISNYAENALLNTLNGTTFSVAAKYVKLHLGDPSDTGTANAAANTTRQAVSFSTSTSGSVASSGTLTWSSVPSTETYTHWSLWDSVSTGNCLWTGQFAIGASVVAGDTFQITSLTLSLD